MVAAARLATLKGVLAAEDGRRIASLIAHYGLPVAVPSDLDRDVIKTYLKTDKKVMAGKVFYILPMAIGDTVITDDISIAELDEVLLSVPSTACSKKMKERICRFMNSSVTGAMSSSIFSLGE